MGRQKKTENFNCEKDKIVIGCGNPLPIGVCNNGDTVNFAVELLPITDSYLNTEKDETLKVIFYPKNKTESCFEVEFPMSQRVGNVRYMSVSNININNYDYNYSYKGKIFTDVRAGRLVGREIWGKRTENEIRAGFAFEPESDAFDWKDDKKPETAFCDTIIYRMHVRGFTKHISSGVRHKGTFKGIIEKIPYLKSLGITYVELLPAYEFDEVLKLNYPAYFSNESEVMPVNYWGYTDAFYFAPKQAYAVKDAVNEFKELVYMLHREGIELGMEFYFVPGTGKHFITDCLRYWLINYHVDGFHINTDIAPSDIISADPLLASVKLFAPEWNNAGNKPYRNLAVWNRSFMYDVRKFLKGDEGMIERFIFGVLNNSKDVGIVNFLSDHNCFTVKDMVSYEKKHNEANGENNNDGENFNFSWNCGVEGETKKRRVLDCRIKQMKNAWVMLLCSQGIPMIMAGDEFGRTQGGNNNPYCQDNEISWINWNLYKNSKILFNFVKMLIDFRKFHKILHMPESLMKMDSMSCGYPDVSLHGARAWYPDTDYCSRHVGFMFCGRYSGEQNDIYIAYNMYWERQVMALPGLNPGKEWEVFAATDKGSIEFAVKDKTCIMPARSVCIFISKDS